MKPLRLILRILLLSLLIFLWMGIHVSAAQIQGDTAILRGRVTDVDGNPLPNATVIIIDWYFQRALPPLRTDIEGHYELEVKGGYPHSYRVYAYLTSNERIFAPSTIEREFQPLIGEVMQIPDLRLVPGAMLNLTGEVWNVFTGRYALSLKAQVLDPFSGKPLTSTVDPKVGDYTPFQGDNVTSVFVNPDWMSPFLSPLSWIIIIIPANRPVEIKIIASQPGAPDQVFIVRNGSDPIKLPENSILSIDITPFAYKWCVSAAQKASEHMWTNIYEAERFGFFLESLKDTAFKNVDLQIKAAVFSIERGNLTVEGVQMPLKRAYLYATNFIPKELAEMKSIAEEGAMILPFFLAIFSISLAFFLSEKERFLYRLLSFTSIFVITIICFYFIYPGMPLFLHHYSNMFYTAILGSFSLGLFIVLILPKIIYESGNPVKISLRSVLAVAFMLGKRYVKIRRFRSSLIIISICVMISALTTLTTVKTFYGLEFEVIGNSTGEWIFMKNPGEIISTFVPIDLTTLHYIKEEPDVKIVIPKAETTTGQYSMQLVKEGRKQTILGIIGVIPSLEKKYVDLKVYGRYPEEESSLMVSSVVAQKLGLTINSNVSLRIFSGGLSFELPMKVVGIFDDKNFNEKKDLNGELYAPTTLVNEKIVPCNASQVILISFHKALELAAKPYSLPISISRVIIEFKDPSNKDRITEFIQTYAWAKGFHVWISSEGKLIHYFIGKRVEMRFFDMVVPMVIVMLSIGMVMYDAVSRRHREIFVYTTVGFNPMHIVLVFLAESAIMGLLGGWLGYFTGLIFFKMLKFISGFMSVGVRENLQWWMSVLGVITGTFLATVSAIPASLKAAWQAAPSILRRTRLSAEEDQRRYEEIYKAFGERRFTIPINVKVDEVAFYRNFIYDQLMELTGGSAERIENLEEGEEATFPDGSETISIPFRYIFTYKGQQFSLSNKIVMKKKRDESFFRLSISSTVEQEGMPEFIRERVAKLIYNISLRWMKEKKKILKSYIRSGGI